MGRPLPGRRYACAQRSGTSGNSRFLLKSGLKKTADSPTRPVECQLWSALYLHGALERSCQTVPVEMNTCLFAHFNGYTFARFVVCCSAAQGELSSPVCSLLDFEFLSDVNRTVSIESSCEPLRTQTPRSFYSGCPSVETRHIPKLVK